jgi:hypothetical protein
MGLHGLVTGVALHFTVDTNAHKDVMNLYKPDFVNLEHGLV